MNTEQSIKTALELIKKVNAKFIDVKFCDLLGQWQHTTIPISFFKKETFEEGIMFDGSSIRAWKEINESDMKLIPDAETAVADPFHKVSTISVIADVYEPEGHSYSRSPRTIAQRAEAYLKSTGIADIAYFGPEAEFFVFDNVQFGNEPNHAFFKIDSKEAHWNTSSEEGPNLGHKVKEKGGYFPVPPHDSLVDLRAEMAEVMVQAGIPVECLHHEVATAGQCEIDIRYNTLVKQADTLLLYKYIVKNVALRNGKTATFMPKPLFGDNGSGMHVHQSLWKNGDNLFFGNGYAGLSEMALYYIGGVIKHSRAIAAITNPTMNSYKRLVPGYEAPIYMAYSNRNRSAAIRIPASSGKGAKRIEVRFPDPTANPYLAFAVMLLAGIDGIKNKIHPGDPLDKDIYKSRRSNDFKPMELNINVAPESLGAALKELERDHEFLLAGEVFTSDVINTWIDWKYQNEIRPHSMRVTPFEYHQYFDL